MEKDGRYKDVRLLFKKGQIHSFSEIFSRGLLPKTVLARDLKKNNNTITKLLRSPGGFKIKDLIRLREFFELPLTDLARLFKSDLKDNDEADHAQKDDGYDRVKAYFNAGKIKQFRDIFDYVPVTKVAQAIGKGRGRFEPLERFSIEHISRIGKLSEISLEKMFKLIDRQLMQQSQRHIHSHPTGALPINTQSR